MKVKTNKLTDAALDWAVAIAKGIPSEELKLPWSRSDGLFRYLRDEDGKLNGCYLAGPDLLFSQKWEAGGPIIEQAGIGLVFLGDEWSAGNAGGTIVEDGPTPLIAAMRCYVSSKLGDSVDVPEELLK
jgi:hypothetical protein